MVVDAAKLHRPRHRRESGRALIEGPKLVWEALAAGIRLEAVFVEEGDEESAGALRDMGISPVTVNGRALRRVAGTETPRGPVAVIEVPVAEVQREVDLLVSAGVSDPGNVGTLIRTAAAFGWGYGYTPGSADPWSPKALRAGAGGHFRAPVVPLAGIGELGGWFVLATLASGGEPVPRSVPRPVALLVGEEASGLGEELIAAADVTVTVPMPGGTESLNVAAVASILVYELSKPGGPADGPV